MTKSRKRYWITREWLGKYKACHKEIVLFMETFGERVEVTPENIMRAASVGLDIFWIADQMDPVVFDKWSLEEDNISPGHTPTREDYACSIELCTLFYRALIGDLK